MAARKKTRKRNPLLTNKGWKQTAGVTRSMSERIDRAIAEARKSGKLATAERLLKKRNPDTNEAAAAKELYSKFHQAPAKKTKVVAVPNKRPLDVAELGTVTLLVVKTPDKGTFKLQPKGVILASSANGKQLYFLGGDQASTPIVAMGADPERHFVRLGSLQKIGYLTRKGFHDFDLVDYRHTMGEEGGWKPDLCFDTINKILFVNDGSYQAKRAGIIR